MTVGELEEFLNEFPTYFIVEYGSQGFSCWIEVIDPATNETVETLEWER